MVGLIFVVLLGMVGLVIDLSGLFVVKMEFQLVVDSCVLLVVQELDGVLDVLIWVMNVGLIVGNVNCVVY